LASCVYIVVIIATIFNHNSNNMIEHLPRTICYAIVVDGDIAGLVATGPSAAIHRNSPARRGLPNLRADGMNGAIKSNSRSVRSLA
jgi:hypothetical protein